MSFVNRTLVCRDCGTNFTFTAGEQAFYQQKGFQHEPVRCPNCRRSKKDGGGGGGGGNYADRGERASMGGMGGGSRPKFKAVCSACGAETEVPFMPSGNRPVYCRSCFNDRRP